MDLFEQLERAEAEFRRRLTLVSDDDWSRPTPCSQWDVRALVNHVLGGPRRNLLLLNGASREEVDATRTEDHVGDKPSESFEAGARAVAAAFREPGALARVVDHHTGQCAGEELLKRRVVDNAIHAWDLARAVGADDRLDAGLVRALWERLSVEGTGLVAGHFGSPPTALAPDATQQDRLLNLLGRSPSWSRGTANRSSRA